MDSEYPFLEVKRPDISEDIIKLEDIIQQQKYKNFVTIGRSQENDIVLPDPHKKVSRRHCVLEHKIGHWWVVDEGSANGTFVQRTRKEDFIDVRSDGKLALADGDEILILGKFIEPDDYIFWHFKFRDPNQTQEVKTFQYVESLEYNLNQEKLFRKTSRNREEINLTPQERRLIHYMAQCNHNKDEAVMCSYEELLQAIWLEKFGHTNAEVNRLIWSIRNKIEADSGEPKFLQTVKGSGYILYINIEKY
ncbi:MAG: FHA domain-containing protein [Cyanobacteria bacterium J06635_10]